MQLFSLSLSVDAHYVIYMLDIDFEACLSYSIDMVVYFIFLLILLDIFIDFMISP